MADLTITAADVEKTSGRTETRTAGVAVTAGQLVYVDSSDSSKAKLADADALATADLRGVALCDAAADQPVTILLDGVYNPGATVTVNEIYIVSATAGGIAPIGDLASGDFLGVFGYATADNRITLHVAASGVAKA